MRLVLLGLFSLLLSACASHGPFDYQDEGMASYYGARHHGNKTASGEPFNQYALTAAHRSLPFGSKVKVTNLGNGKSVVVRINDRGPHTRGRIIDLSYQAAKDLAMLRDGVARVRVQQLAD
ncbi:septal ring lytic transglycosylase RlpA family protein [Pseudomonas sp. 5P_3.1_Bac2]|uniref:septal ring lytic transglycosylase RlpA family protein n=1 Tax=Pseudomonas sp. 5P_3.1_Bac2 TaxID=2971617 RepID=UPI0021C5E18D|nr:septal ring lytic transglycosylase RlpA family protein [Pseudomonas sp. 5P_3.1_Bac2]MCU1715626.1 septal ring lytic transglycosylase RlpA family protein [Pseudomonas sp. 5P_3.1_Bac2]